MATGITSKSTIGDATKAGMFASTFNQSKNPLSAITAGAAAGAQALKILNAAKQSSNKSSNKKAPVTKAGLAAAEQVGKFGTDIVNFQNANIPMSTQLATNIGQQTGKAASRNIASQNVGKATAGLLAGQAATNVFNQAPGAGLIQSQNLPMSSIYDTAQSSLDRYNQMFPNSSASAQAQAQMTQQQNVGGLAGTPGVTGGVSGGGISGGGVSGGGGQTPYEQAIANQIQQSYLQNLDFYNQQQKNLAKQLPDVMNVAASPYEQQIPLLQSQLAAAQQKNAEDIAAQQAQEQQNLATIRNAGQEQQMRAIQQFGGVGGSSAAQAAGEILGREQLRQLGAARTTAQTNQFNLQNQLRAVQSDYDAKVATLQLQRNQAVAAARIDFNKQLQSIQTEKAKLGQTKSAQVIDALTNFAKMRQDIDMQVMRFQQGLEANRQAAALQAQMNAQEGGGSLIGKMTDVAERGNLIRNAEAQSGGNVQSPVWNQIGLQYLYSDAGRNVYRTGEGEIINSDGNIIGTPARNTGIGILQ